MKAKCIAMIVVALYIGMGNAAAANTVEVKNSLQFNKDLKVHCRSNVGDKGEHIVPPHQSYSFTFTKGLNDDPTFTCDLWQGPGYKHHQYFLVRIGGFLPVSGRVFSWDAREDGTYFKEDNGAFVLKYSWDVPH